MYFVRAPAGAVTRSEKNQSVPYSQMVAFGRLEHMVETPHKTRGEVQGAVGDTVLGTTVLRAPVSVASAALSQCRAVLSALGSDTSVELSRGRVGCESRPRAWRVFSAGREGQTRAG